ncbi:UDP-glucose 4-epimerase GalE [Sporanaerobium hydrogeniformans]|uniref:UDP-glucose 4-epimerase GalE n=1 Tax=Sporanaerobium hydrogeniformans TaxID=3072179 RepID=A0AC61DC60_9FIRM|nr:UDP-glucose 4-epimerase GalE [Sporanaerobium hydrogeniformans]PHV70117.1 UDP-glucose 4-epimerase GalE [Sporanaerobium hydrogeniformans]
MKILVVGGAGYIGSHAVKQLLENQMEVVIIDNLETGHIESVPKDVPFYQVDIRNKEALNEVFKKEQIDGVIHFAANSLVGESMTKPLKYYNNNVGGAETLLEVLIENGVKYIVFSSTAATYGDVKTMPISEETLTCPTNTYGETKLAIEKMLKWTHQAHDLHYVCLRYFNVAGADESGMIGEAHTTETHLIPLILQVPLGQREHITVFGQDYETSDGTCIRDYIHVTDLVDAHILALDYLMKGGESDIFNLGSNSGYSVLEMIEAAREVTGHPIPLVVGPRRSGDPALLIASSEKAKKILGWTPKRTDIKEMIASAWKWHRTHPRGYKED